MPISSKETIHALDQDAFHRVDRFVMGEAFKIHNSMGRLLEEKIYQSALDKACEQSQFKCRREVQVTANHKSFSKSYYLDLIVDGGAIYEIKTVPKLTSNHDAQLLNYLLLTDTQHGKLINFRSKSVEYRFVSTSLRTCDRYSFSIDSTDWREVSESCSYVKAIVKNLLSDLGSHLHISLYSEAIVEILGGENKLQPVALFAGSNRIGEQLVCLLSKDVALHISSIKQGVQSYQTHLQRFLESTKLKSIQWLNFDNHQITLRSLNNK
ncbi:MAG: GxxExxY protein [Opitutaceae bacterium]